MSIYFIIFQNLRVYGKDSCQLRDILLYKPSYYNWPCLVGGILKINVTTLQEKANQLISEGKDLRVNPNLKVLCVVVQETTIEIANSLAIVRLCKLRVGKFRKTH